MSLAHRLDRTITILASRETVFRFFTDSARWEKWWGAGSSVDPRPGGQLRIRYPNGIEALGEVLEVIAPERIVFTFGYASGTPIPLGGSRVTIELVAEGSATRLQLAHELADAHTRDQHVQGWRYQLALVSNLVTDEVNARVADVADVWLTAWAELDDAKRHDVLARVALPTVRFRDRYGATDGIDDLTSHIGAAQRFMPGVTLTRKGAVRHCQGTALCEWVAEMGGHPAGHGTNVFTLGADGRLESVTGFWAVPDTPIVEGVAT